MEEIQAALETWTESLQGLIVPLAVLGVILWGIAFLVVPLLPTWASGMRGYLQAALVVVGFLGFVPGLIAAMYEIGGGEEAAFRLVPMAAVMIMPNQVAWVRERVPRMRQALYDLGRRWRRARQRAD